MGIDKRPSGTIPVGIEAQIDELAIYDAALTGSSVVAHFAAAH